MVKAIKAFLCIGLFKSTAGKSFFSPGVLVILFFLEIKIPTGTIISPSNRNPGKII